MSDSVNYQSEILPTAMHDMTSIISMYLMAGSRNGAIRMKNAFDKGISQLESFPYSGIQVPDEKLAKFGFRMLIIEKYLVFHKVFDDEKKIVIYHVLNGTTDYPTLMKRIHQL